MTEPYWEPLAAAPGPSYGTTLPASPVDGQEAVLVDSLTAPTYQWRFRYNAGSSSAYKWEFIGGDDYWATAFVGAANAIPNGFSAQPPVFYTPRAGDWDTWGEAQFSAAAVPNLVQLGTGTTAASLATAGSVAVASGYVTLPASGVLTGVASGTQISLWAYGQTSVTIANAWLRVRPRRVA